MGTNKTFLFKFVLYILNYAFIKLNIINSKKIKPKKEKKI